LSSTRLPEAELVVAQVFVILLALFFVEKDLLRSIRGAQSCVSCGFTLLGKGEDVDALRVVVDCDLDVGLLDLSCAAGRIKAENLVVGLVGKLGRFIV
jgi:hypothetical protein